MNRREILASLSVLGIGSPALVRALSQTAQEKKGLSVDDIKNAEWITDYELTDQQREDVMNNVKRMSRQFKGLRKTPLAHLQGPSFYFRPQYPVLPSAEAPAPKTFNPRYHELNLPGSDEEIAFLPVEALANLVHSGKLTSVRLTKIYLKRLKKYGPMLRCVVSLLEESALKRAAEMDTEIAAGKLRSPIHGIPWGAKDLIDVEGTKTSWGIPVYKDRDSETTATVAQRIEDAGGVLVAKLSLGAIANGDKWFGGMTRNPWNPRTGSSGSSAGSCSAVIAGLVGFTLGSETLGSITTPSRICGASGFRPTFGRVSRHGCMPLSWTMDKIGPICRSASDCMTVFEIIHGADGKDHSAHTFALERPEKVDLGDLVVGYTEQLKDPEVKPALAALKKMGCKLVPFRMPSVEGLFAMPTIINVEAASVFDHLLREGETEGWNDWPESFRAAQFVSAIDYLRIQRRRVELMQEVEQAMAAVDILVDVNDVFHTNLTGHPSVVVPTGYKDAAGGGKTPECATFTGHLCDDARLLAIATQFQASNPANQVHPGLDVWLAKFDAGTLDERAEKEKEE